MTLNECSFIIETNKVTAGLDMRKKDDEKRNSIKRAVTEIILEQGMHGASISKIAKSAGVSPATVYIYYENKNEMLRDIYNEYAEDIFSHLLHQLNSQMSGEQFIDNLIRGYYGYITQNEEAYHFVEQFDFCPTLKKGCCTLHGPDMLNAMLTEYIAHGIINSYDTKNIWGMLFYPVKAIANKPCTIETSPEDQLNEMIMIIQKALLK